MPYGAADIHIFALYMPLQLLITSVQEVMNIIINFTIDRNPLIYHYNRAFFRLLQYSLT